MKMSRFALTLTVLTAFGMPFGASVARAQAAPVKIAYVDMQRVASEIEELKVAKAKLKKTFDAKQKELDAKQESLLKEKEALEAAAREGVMSQEKLRDKAAELDKKYKAVLDYLQTAQKSLMDDQAKALQAILSKASAIVRAIATERGYSFVLNGDPQVMLYGDEQFDITDEVIKRYNAKPPPKK